MAVPIVYSVRSVRARWKSTLVAVLSIAGSVAVFIAMLAMANGFKATMVNSGSADNAIIRRAGATSEMESALTLEQLKVIEGRFLQPGLAEIVVGRNARVAYEKCDIGQTIKLGGREFHVVGVFDAGGSAFDSELWTDVNVLAETYKRPANVFQSITVKLSSADALTALKDALTADPRMTVQVDREVEYYQKQSAVLSTLINVLGILVAMVMGLGAVFGALNTMYSAISDRSREIGTLRAIGFSGSSILWCFLFEALLIAFAGAVVGCVVVLPMQGYTVGTMNWQTFSHMSFGFSITPALLGMGTVFALVMGVLGGLPAAARAVRVPITAALRHL